MKNAVLKLFMVFLACASVVACSSNTQRENTAIGVVAGALTGGVAGSFIGQGTGKVVAIGVGAIAGGLIGGAIGSSMDSSDCSKTYEVLSNNQTNKSSHWKNRKTHTAYTVTPTSNVMATSGYNYCRTYTTKAVINGKVQQVNGTACRQSDGTWKTINS